jgi:hypothetical protein
MIRIAKAGYVEVPSRAWETCRGKEPGIAGLSHHRWLIDIGGNGIRFILKFHRIHNWRYSLPSSTLKKLSAEESVQWLFWEHSFDYSEQILHGEAQTRELERFVNSIRPYSALALAADDIATKVKSYYRRGVGKAHRLIQRKTG